MTVRKGDLKDLNACVLIDNSYVTDNVWQVQAEERPYEETVITFRTVRLPRSMRVSPPRDTDFLLQDWERGECFLIADEGDEIRGYLDMTVQAWNRTGWIKDMAVPKRYRRQGIGTTLLRAALRWARSHDLRAVMLETQTKNYPAICFFRKHGFIFCGFNDHYYSNQDIAVFFAYHLH
jgi:ribosomal protein S18 acetylase RimI-like enzyme